MYIANKKDFWTALVILALMGICWNESQNIDTGINFALGPLFFPYFLMGAIAICSIAMLLRSIGRGLDGKGGEAAAVPGGRRILLIRLFLLASTCAYIVALPYGGYTACTIIYLMLAMCGLGKRDPRHIAIYGAISLAMTFVLYWVFSGLLHLFLP